jgi:hypothetical protein
LIVLALAALLTAPAQAACPSAFEEQVLDLVNVERAKKKLAAGARLCRDQLRCWSKLASKPGADPNRTNLAACLTRAGDRFALQWDGVRQQAAADAAVCQLDEAGSARAAGAEAQLQSLADAVIVGADPADKNDAKLRAGLLGNAGSLCSDISSAEGRHAAKPDSVRLGATRAKARAKFDSKSAKALGKATSKGVTYDGTAPASLGDQTEALVDGWASDATP